MTITLDDVAQEIGIPVMGKAVYGSTPMDIEEASKLIFESLNLLMSEIVKEFDKTGSTVPVSYLRFLVDVDHIRAYGWGAVALAHLYRQLGIATRAKCKQISGCLTLLEVEFDPCRAVRDRRPLEEFTFFKGCLCINNISEPYMSDRDFRQLGHVQIIPGTPIQPQRDVRRNQSATSYRVDYPGSVQLVEQWVDSVLSSRTRGDPVCRPSEAVLEYLGWFRRNSHMIVQNPQNKKLVHMASTSSDL
ncbi:hypothetical protein QJS10_CPA01g01826 [Acorus calamus]|uniref:Aminotransferase-like plant mobile domain-containing protein n=1 Tax=Acorus calamus TaxID=4465 RepID=A0AAV9FJB1_ACOCL|nr:hypothetical protein QJS10_CPA01g01826 [Acorus calamus]